MDNDFNFCSDAETAFKKFAKLYFSTCHCGTSFAGIPGGTTRRQGQRRQGHCIKYALLREVHSSLKPYPLEFNRKFLAHSLTDIQFKLEAMAVVRKLLPYYERNVSGFSSAFFWNGNKICASNIKFYFLLNELMSNVETCFKIF